MFTKPRFSWLGMLDFAGKGFFGSPFVCPVPPGECLNINSADFAQELTNSECQASLGSRSEISRPNPTERIQIERDA